jgi:hypothetical protein
MFRLASFTVLLSMAAAAEVRVNVNVDLGQYYHRPAQEIIVLEQRRVPDDELPVVLFLAERANVSAAIIWEHRQRGMHWADIGARYGVGADVFYVPLSFHPGPPYGHAYGYYRRVPRNHWHTIRLDDADVVNLVNLRFLSNHYGYAPERIVTWRSGGSPFVRIHDVAYREGWKDAKQHEKERRADWREERKEDRERHKENKKDRKEHGKRH